MTHSMRPVGRAIEKIFGPKNIGRFGQAMQFFGQKFGFLLALAICVELWGHMIAQNDALGNDALGVPLPDGGHMWV